MERAVRIIDNSWRQRVITQDIICSLLSLPLYLFHSLYPSPSLLPSSPFSPPLSLPLPPLLPLFCRKEVNHELHITQDYETEHDHQERMIRVGLDRLCICSSDNKVGVGVKLHPREY